MGVKIETDLEGKINNLPSFKSEALLPLFEAVVNSIQAIEDRDDVTKGRINIRVNRSSQLPLSENIPHDQPIMGFEIEDDGVGFNPVNYKSFLTSDTTHKLARGCKGIGRFYWLKAFEKAEVESVYCNNGEYWLRKILFTPKDGFRETAHERTEQPQKTIIKLSGYKKDYQEQPSSFKTTKKIAQRILEHCLSFYISSAVPHITIYDDAETISLDDMFKEIQNDIVTESFTIKEHAFHISHIKLYATHSKVHNMVFCANSRDVISISIDKFLGTSQHFDEDNRKFVYTAYVSGEYLDTKVSQDRISFDIPECGLWAITDLNLEQIKEASQEKIREYLADYLVKVREQKQDIVNKYVAEKNPTLRAVVHYCPAIFDEIEPNSSDEKIDEILYKHKGKAEYAIRRRGSQLIKSQAESVSDIKDEYEEVTKELEEFQKDNLAAYIVLRKMIIDLLSKKLNLNKDNQFEREKIVHDIILPRKSTTDELDFEKHNLWIIDERLAFHAFATSDKPLCQTTSSDSTERPDILIFSETGDDRVARAVSIIELKRPQRDKIEEDPTKQLYRYVRQIQNNTVSLHNGRPLNISEATRYYCYTICDITHPIKEYAENANFTKLKDGLGYYTYNRNLNAHTEIIAFDKLVSDVQCRHKAFFEKLGI